MRLSTNFTLAEFLVSQTAARHDIDMTPPQSVVDNLQRLCREILQPLRAVLNSPVIVTSGYRPEELNRLIGGSPTSQHVRGEAADIRVVGYATASVWRQLESMDLPIHQLIYEFGSWVHVSINPEGLRPDRDLLTALREGGQTVYKRGLYV